ncbi:toll/interleukin-1 receptor domain-containing protein [Microbacterium sp. F51-2R]|uniref:toll/interleukin-1 receptor domain-containing protein n=1 Tax=Microbacterium sp. F51-2R TaxID=3445777 RepID=UPI003FA00B83
MTSETEIDSALAGDVRQSALAAIARGSTDQPRAFLSYAWSGPAQLARVKTFADRLLGNGIDVLLDIYDNRPGHDLAAFMERTVTDDSVGFVLVIADRAYATKADARQGGVGTETQLISQEVYNRIDQEKFVALIFERDEHGHPYLPAYMKSRHYIDFTDADAFEASLDELVRHIYGEPKYVKPALGRRPVFDSNSSQPHTLIPRTRAGAPTSGSFVDAVDDFIDHLHASRTLAPGEGQEIDDFIVEQVEAVEPLIRELLVQLDRTMQSDVTDAKLVDFIDDLLVRAKSQEGPPVGASSWRDADYEHIGFAVHELAVSVVALLIKHRRYESVHRLINHTYFYEDHRGSPRAGTFDDFYSYNEVLDRYRNERLQLRRVSVSADMHREHAAHFKVVDFSQLIAADSMLHLLTRFQFPEQERRWWFPKLSVFRSRHGDFVAPLNQMVSRERADKIAKMFGAENVAALQVAYADAEKRSSDGSVRGGWDYNIPTFSNMFPDNIATLP